MLILIIIDVQYLQKAVLSFEKVQIIKITPPQVPTTKFPLSKIYPHHTHTHTHTHTHLTVIWKTLYT